MRIRPCIVQISKDAHKKLKIMAAEQGRTMGKIVETLIEAKRKKDEQKQTKPATNKSQY